MKGLGAATLSDDLHGSVGRPHGDTDQSSGGGQLPAITTSPGSADEGDDDGVLNRVTGDNCLDPCGTSTRCPVLSSIFSL